MPQTLSPCLTISTTVSTKSQRVIGLFVTPGRTFGLLLEVT